MRSSSSPRPAATLKRGLVAAAAVVLAAASRSPAHGQSPLPPTVLSMPDDAVGTTGGTVLVPIEATPADGILALDMRLEFVPGAIQAVNVTKRPISQSHTLTFNNATPGVLIISLFGVAPLVGSGPILDVHFMVSGVNGQVTALDLTQGTINEGGIPSTLDDGLFTVCGNCDDASACTIDSCQPMVGCQHDPDPGALPTEVAGLAAAGSDPTALAWVHQGSGTRYDVVSGLLADLVPDQGVDDGLCLHDDEPAASSTDARPGPPGGTGFYYVVRAQNVCGNGTYGYTSSGIERQPASGCP